MELSKLCRLLGWQACNDKSSTKFTFSVGFLKGFFSIVLMALVDADYRFIYVDVGDFGSNGDSGISLELPSRKELHGG